MSPIVRIGSELILAITLKIKLLIIHFSLQLTWMGFTYGILLHEGWNLHFYGRKNAGKLKIFCNVQVDRWVIVELNVRLGELVE